MREQPWTCQDCLKRSLQNPPGPSMSLPQRKQPKGSGVSWQQPSRACGQSFFYQELTGLFPGALIFPGAGIRAAPIGAGSCSRFKVRPDHR
jgi:hypothetical protein